MNKARIVVVVWVMSGRPHRRKTRQRRNEAVPLLCVRTSTSSRTCAGRRSTRWIVSGRCASCRRNSECARTPARSGSSRLQNARSAESVVRFGRVTGIADARAAPLDRRRRELTRDSGARELRPLPPQRTSAVCPGNDALRGAVRRRSARGARTAGRSRRRRSGFQGERSFLLRRLR